MSNYYIFIQKNINFRQKKPNHQTGELIKTLTDNFMVHSLCFSDGKFILSGSYVGSIKLWKIESGENPKSFK